MKDTKWEAVIKADKKWLSEHQTPPYHKYTSEEIASWWLEVGPYWVSYKLTSGDVLSRAPKA